MRLYYEEIDLEISYTDEHLYSQLDILDPRAEDEKPLEELGQEELERGVK